LFSDVLVAVVVVVCLSSLFLQRVALGVSATACGLSSHGGRLQTLELNRAFFMSQDGSSLIACFFEKVTARKNKQFTFFPARHSVLNQFLASQTLNENPSQ